MIPILRIAITFDALFVIRLAESILCSSLPTVSLFVHANLGYLYKYKSDFVRWPTTLLFLQFTKLAASNDDNFCTVVNYVEHRKLRDTRYLVYTL